MQVTTLAEANEQRQRLETTLESLRVEWEQTCIGVSDELRQLLGDLVERDASERDRIIQEE